MFCRPKFFRLTGSLLTDIGIKAHANTRKSTNYKVGRLDQAIELWMQHAGEERASLTGQKEDPTIDLPIGTGSLHKKFGGQKQGGDL